jgi:uncharacterized Tic20 family protein
MSKEKTTMSNPAQQQNLSSSDDQQWASFAHLGGIIGPLPSLIIWLVFKDRGPFTNVEAKEALNFQITATIAYVATVIVTSLLSSILWFLVFLISFAPLIVWVFAIIWSILGFQKSREGAPCRYPINLRFIK